MKVNMALSGGMDSAAVLAHFLSNGFQVECFGFQYGSKHNPFENPCAEAVARWYGVPYTLLDLRPIMAGFRSNLMADGGAIPEGHYEAPTMNLTVVPGRNIIFLSILAGIAWSRGASLIGIGIHQGDHAIYPDCRVSFFQAMDLAIQKGTDGRVRLIAPFLSTDKAGIVKWGIEHQVPFHLTRTCYKAQPLACGKCGSCRERIEAFEKNEIRDPVEYE